MLRIVVLAWFLLVVPAFGQETRFIDALEDVPLAPGLTVAEEGFAFEGAEGRILEAWASGAAQAAAVEAYYDASLPQLGWARVGQLAYQRDRERLSLILRAQGDAGLDVRFRLVAPRPARALDGKDSRP